jgi:hypothetical protein
MIDIEILRTDDVYTLNPIGIIPTILNSETYNSAKYESIHQVYIKIFDMGTTFGEYREMRLIINKLTGWTKPQIESYLESPFEIDLVLSENDIVMTAHGLSTYCPNAKFYFIDQKAKREQKLNILGI